MYRHCIYCSADLGANESIEAFPVGRSLAFDAAKGRLWAVCPKCSRWNLAPIEERWEAIESAEKLFRDSRLRAQSENVGLAKLRDGTRLVRIGEAPAGELAAWRYGRRLRERRGRFLLRDVASRTAAMGVFLLVPVTFAAWMLAEPLVQARRRSRVVYLAPPAAPGRPPVPVRRRHLDEAYLHRGEDGAGVELHLPEGLGESARTFGGFHRPVRRPLVLRGEPARAVLGRTLAIANARGATRRQVGGALDRLVSAGSPEGYLHLLAGTGARLFPGSGAGPSVLLPEARLALEMALHEESERRALEGELALLASAWREAEEIASIADRLATASIAGRKA